MKKESIIQFITILLLCIFLQSCGYTCPGFDDKDLCWIPHNIGDKLRYTDGENVIGFSVTDFYKTEASKHSGLAMDYVCDYYGYYSTNTVNGYFIKEQLVYNVANFGSWGDGMIINISDNDTFIFDVWIDLFEPVSMNVKNNDLHFYPDTVIANKSYTLFISFSSAVWSIILLICLKKTFLPIRFST